MFLALDDDSIEKGSFECFDCELSGDAKLLTRLVDARISNSIKAMARANNAERAVSLVLANLLHFVHGLWSQENVVVEWDHIAPVGFVFRVFFLHV